jgi:hypothetical protein
VPSWPVARRPALPASSSDRVESEFVTNASSRGRSDRGTLADRAGSEDTRSESEPPGRAEPPARPTGVIETEMRTGQGVVARSAAILVIAGFAAACGGAGPTPAPTPTPNVPTVTLTPTPVATPPPTPTRPDLVVGTEALIARVPNPDDGWRVRVDSVAHARLGRWRRLSRCYEGTEASAKAWLEVVCVAYLFVRLRAEPT